MVLSFGARVNFTRSHLKRGHRNRRWLNGQFLLAPSLADDVASMPSRWPESVCGSGADAPYRYYDPFAQAGGPAFRYVVATGRGESDPTVVLRGALIAPRVAHHAALLEPEAVGGLLRSRMHIRECDHAAWMPDRPACDGSPRMRSSARTRRCQCNPGNI